MVPALLPRMPTTIEFRSVAHAGDCGAPVFPAHTTCVELATCTASDLAMAFERARAAVAQARVAADRALLFSSLLAK